MRAKAGYGFGKVNSHLVLYPAADAALILVYHIISHLSYLHILDLLDRFLWFTQNTEKWIKIVFQ